MKLVYACNFNEMSGFSEAARGYLKVFGDLVEIFNVTIEGTSVGKIENSIKTIPQEDYCLIWHFNPNVFENCLNGKFDKTNGSFLKKLLLNSKKNFAINAWETDRIPESHYLIYEKYKTDFIMVPSSYNVNAYHNLKTYKMHHYITPNKSSPFLSNSLNRKKFFLSISQWNYRKNFKDLILSFLLEFFDEEVFLVLKTYVSHNKSGREIISNEIKNLKTNMEMERSRQSKCKIILLTNYIKEEEKNFLLQRCVAYCGTSISEGFGIGYAEAAIYKKPVIAPNRGGQADFLSKKYLFDTYEDHYKGPAGYGYTAEMKVNYPIITSVRKKMREAYESREPQDHHLQNKDHIRKIFVDCLKNNGIINEKNTTVTKNN